MQDEKTELCIKITGLVQIALWEPKVGFVWSVENKKYTNTSAFFCVWGCVPAAFISLLRQAAPRGIPCCSTHRL